jgi:urease accessory protein
MIRFSKVVPQGRGLAQVLLRRSPEVALDWDTRSRSRFDATDSAGRAVAVFLPRGQVLRGGDVLVGEDGSLLRVQAAPQPVLRVTHCSAHGHPHDLQRAAYHLGNRHVALELAGAHLQLEPDHVLAQMLQGMHLIVQELEAPFEPEAGAYGGGHGAGHGPHAHGHDHGHAHSHAHEADHAAHDHDHDHGHSHAHGADHGPHGHGRDHGHDHSHPHDHGHAPARGDGR